LIKSWFKFENYIVPNDFNYLSEYQAYYKNKYSLLCPKGHIFLTSIDMWVNNSRCKICNGNGKSFSFEEIKNQYKLHNCEVLYTEDDYTGNISNTIIPFKCINKHIIDNLTKNDFNNRINSNLNVCKICSDNFIGCSNIQLEWIKYIENKYNIILQHFNNLGEFVIKGIGKVDGYHKESNTVYEFHGDFWHGNPKIFNPLDIHPLIKKSYGKLLKNTLHREIKIRNLGFKYICIWENEFKKNKKIVKI
jgi:hypothetical protein